MIVNDGRLGHRRRSDGWAAAAGRLVIDADGNVVYAGLVPEIGVEPSFEAGLAAPGSSV